MSGFLEELEKASEESSGTCKICAYLGTLPSDEAVGADRLIRAKEMGRNKISADRVATILKANGCSTGATTVRRHRVNCAPIQEP